MCASSEERRSPRPGTTASPSRSSPLLGPPGGDREDQRIQPQAAAPAGDPHSSPERTFPEIEHTIAIHDLPDNQIVDIDHEIWVPKNWRLQLYFENGPACPLWVLHQELISWKDIPTPPGASEAERREIRRQNQAAEPKTPQSKDFLRTAISPRIRLHKMVIDGPYYRSWPPECQQGALCGSRYHGNPERLRSPGIPR